MAKTDDSLWEGGGLHLR